MKPGDIVSVSGHAGEVSEATILDLRLTSEVAGHALPFSDEARAILRNEYRRVALIEYFFGPGPGQGMDVAFIALEDKNGVWCDLHGQVLQIVPVRQRSGGGGYIH